MLERCNPLEPIFLTSAREMFCTSPGVITGSGKTWIGRSLGWRSALTRCQAASPWTLFGSFVSGVEGKAVTGWEMRCATVIPQTYAADRTTNRKKRPIGIFQCLKSIGSRLWPSAGTLRRMDAFRPRRALARLKSDQIPDRSAGIKRQGMRALLAGETSLDPAQSLSAPFPRFRKVLPGSLIALRKSIGRHAHHRKQRSPFYPVIGDHTSDNAIDRDNRFADLLRAFEVTPIKPHLQFVGLTACRCRFGGDSCGPGASLCCTAPRIGH